MILNQTKNFMYHNTEVQELRYESTLIWKRGIPETHGLSTILYREDFDVESGTWRDTTHRKSFTSNDFGVNQNGAVSMSYTGIDTIVNGVQNGFTIYTVIESSNFLNDWSQVADLNNGSDLTIYTGSNGRLKVSSVIYGSSYCEFDRFGQYGLTPYGLLVLRYEPSTREFSAYGANGTSHAYEKLIFSLTNPVNATLVADLNRQRQNTSVPYSYLHFFAIGETYHTDEEVIANCSWLREKYLIY